MEFRFSDLYHYKWSANFKFVESCGSDVRHCFGVRSIFVNGLKIDSHTNAPVAVYSSITPVTIGAWLRGPDSSEGYFQGAIDEVSFYGRALSYSEIQAIYIAGSAGKCIGSIPPGIAAQPVNQTAVQGSNVVLSVTASGSGPFTYQWTLNGRKIPGATASTLSLNNLHPNQAEIMQ
ncbi:MAG: LamG-like jellyroll fold domain-containing protein [Limisphaerales bacterium]